MILLISFLPQLAEYCSFYTFRPLSFTFVDLSTVVNSYISSEALELREGATL